MAKHKYATSPPNLTGMNTPAFVALRRVGQSLRRFKSKIFRQASAHIANTASLVLICHSEQSRMLGGVFSFFWRARRSRPTKNETRGDGSNSALCRAPDKLVHLKLKTNIQFVL